MQGNYNLDPLDFPSSQSSHSDTGETQWRSTFDFLAIPPNTEHGATPTDMVQPNADGLILTEVPRPHDHTRPLRRFARFPAIDFRVNGRKGIRLADALLANDFSSLADADVQAMETSAAKVTYLVEWPGYSSMRKQMNARRLGGLQSRSRIARQIVEVVEEFIHERCNYNTTETQWRVGPGFIEFGSLYLMELRRISKATWLVVLACDV